MHLRTFITAFSFFLACAGAQAQVVMNIDVTRRGPAVSPYQYGLFFEEINHAGEGGLYAELVRNRSFEEGTVGWTGVGIAMPKVVSTDLMNSAQRNALDLRTTKTSAEIMRGIRNEGFWGMKFVKDSVYQLSLWAKGDNDNYTGNVFGVLVKSNGKTAISDTIALEGTVYTDRWNKLTATIKATETDLSGQLLLLTSNDGHLYLDMVSLFPKTWNKRPNGLRPDLAQLLKDTKPSFLRFPGGCYVEGQNAWEETFQWKKTIGPIEQRPGHPNNNWGYWSSDGLGFDEYLQLCEDLGAAPMYVVNVGLGHGWYIPLEEIDTLVQNTLDAIEYANGDGTTKYGAMRIKNGHVAPYNLKFIEIGNENYNFSMNNNSDQSYQYPERYFKFYKAIKEKYPEIVTIGNVEAWGTDNPTWRNDYPVELVDEHYYRSHSWMRDNYRKYDNYPRNIGVYNGEYAANYGGTFGHYGNMNSALGEAVYMLGMERNSDVCRMASFAPIFTHEQDPKWNYDMIHFNSGSVFVTPSYYVQQLMANNLGTTNLLWTETGNSTVGNMNRQVGLATWDTQATFGEWSLTVGSPAGENLLTDDIGVQKKGSWTIKSDHTMQQTANGQPCQLIFDKQFSGSNYIYKVRARKDSGAEGFLILFDYQDKDNYSWWNIGGWGNSRHGVEVCQNGAKTTVAQTSGAVNIGQWYDIEIRVAGDTVTCLMDGRQIHQYVKAANRALYQSVQLDEKRMQLIVKVVNPYGKANQIVLNTKNMVLGDGSVQRLSSETGTDENSMDYPDHVKPSEPEPLVGVVKVAEGERESAVELDVPAYSLNIFRFDVLVMSNNVEPQHTSADYEEYVKEDEGMAAYLYCHMHETQEITCYALRAADGNTWNDLFDSKEVFDTKANTVTGGMRDAYICRMQSGNGFILAGTDMTSRLGWNSNHIMDLMVSPDLVHWTKNVKIDLETEENLKALSKVYPDMTPDKMTAAWAPQVIYDKETGKYVLYYSVGFPDYHRTFYQLIDEDLNILTEPRLYFDPGYDIIDNDIVWNAVDQQYTMLFKCEASNGFDRATARHLVPQEDGNAGLFGTTVWTVTPGFHIDENNQAIEGMSQWRAIGELRWRVAYINYSNGYVYRMRYMDEHGLNVDPAGHTISGKLKAQHGCVLKITQQEYDYLLTWEQVLTLLPDVKAYHAVNPTDLHREAIEKAEAALGTALPTLDENMKAMEDALKLLKQCDTDLRQLIINQVVEKGEGDLTSLIENADFSKGSQGWTREPEFTQANGEVAEFWNTNFYMAQKLEDLPNGQYELSVQSFYRDGSRSGAKDAHDKGTEQLRAILFSNGQETPVMSLFDNSVPNKFINTYGYPNDVAVANTAFNNYDLYTNTVQLEISDGTLLFGIRNYSHVSDDWCCFDNWKLKYVGPPSGIRETGSTNLNGKAPLRYDLQGKQVRKTQKGIYIEDGRKVLKEN